MSLSEPMRAYMQQAGWLSPDTRYLLAVSGGLDSCAMAALFAELGLEVGLAHCNFQLRGEAADKDAQFVRDLANALGAPFYLATFDTAAYAKQQGLSVQMAARELRYDWLEGTRRDKGYTYIATAHHLDDSIETLLYNMTQGCGIRGLHGIPSAQGPVIRPLLFAERREIAAYAKQQGLAYREDHTNAETKYRRNFLRHKVIPLLRELNPNFEQTMAANIHRFRETEYLYQQMVRQVAQEAILEQMPRFRLSIPALLKHRPALGSLLYELLQPYGFNTAQVQDIAWALSAPANGQQFFSTDYQLLIDRENIIVEERAESEEAVYTITPDSTSIRLPEGRLGLHRAEGQPDRFSADPNQAILSAEALEFPLTLRRWQAGDRFQPFGMGGQHQKLQDFFNNNKVSRFDKAKAWVLEDQSGRIAWLVGYRIGHEFRLTPDSKAHWVLKYEPH
ncbi:MAG: tRNA lysidine(34) synthetase TilS [Bacteroidetes bacterium]|nr:tRNA lysidine(34) synthetase TilS [Bacteroidota bacterium]